MKPVWGLAEIRCIQLNHIRLFEIEGRPETPRISLQYGTDGFRGSLIWVAIEPIERIGLTIHSEERVSIFIDNMRLISLNI